MAKDDVLRVDARAQDRLVQYINATSTIQNDGWQNRQRFENIDRSYMRTADYTAEQKKAQRANYAGDPTKLQNIQVPMVMESVENAVGFLSNVFLLDYPMFKFGASPEAEDVALMWNTLVGEDQIHYGWTGQFNIAFRNSDKYNFAPLECDWCTEKLYKIKNGNGSNGQVMEQEIWSGNKITSHDPYNTIYDSRVPIYLNHVYGEFGGYVKPMSRIQLKLFLASLGDERLKNDVKAFESAAGSIEYYIPQINPDALLRSRGQGEFDWTRWVTDEAQRHIAYKNMYTVVVLYARIMPYEFGIYAPKDQTPDIWKLIKVNDVLVFAQPLENAHNYLPFIIAQSQVDNLDHQTKTSAENQVPFQQMVSSLWNAELNIARRIAVDRMLYNPLLVDPDAINSPNPGAKIPVKPAGYGRKLEEAIHPIPFEGGNASGMYMQAAKGVGDWGMRANGQNNVSVGQFQKGNKLENEFNTTMANAGSRERTKAIMWENFAMQPIKTILKSNYLQFAPQGKKYNRTEKQQVTIDPAKLREVEGEFDVGDGLLPIEKLMHADVAQSAFQAMSSNPAIAQAYETGPFFSYLMELQGVDKLKQFEKDPAQLAYLNALSQWYQGVLEFSKSKAAVTPADLDKLVSTYLGPKPQDPSKQQQTQDPTQQGTQNGNPAA